MGEVRPVLRYLSDLYLYVGGGEGRILASSPMMVRCSYIHGYSVTSDERDGAALALVARYSAL